jgi:hypothetical protein
MEAVLGKKHEENCINCGSPYEIFHGTIELTSPQVNAAKAVLQKVFPDISPEDFDSATNEDKPEDQWDRIAYFVKRDKQAIPELEKRGIYITLDRPKLEAVNDN